MCTTVFGGMAVFHLLCQVALMVFRTEVWGMLYVLWGGGATASP